MPKIGIANGLIDIKDSWPQNNSMNIVNDYKSKKMMK